MLKTGKSEHSESLIKHFQSGLIEHLVGGLKLAGSRKDYLESLGDIIKHIAGFYNFDSVVAYEVGKDPDKKALSSFSQYIGWNFERGFEKRNFDAIDIPVIPYFERWLEALNDGKIVCGSIEDFPHIEQETLEALGIQQILMVPYIQQGKLAGFLTFQKEVNGRPGEWKLPSEASFFFFLTSWLFTEFEKRNTIQELMDEKLNLESQLHSKNQILANLSHEIRTPMNGIVGLAEQLEDLDNDMSKRSYLESIKLSAANLMEVLTGIAEFSKSDTQSSIITDSDIKVREEMETIILPYAEKAAEKGIDFKFTFGDDIPEVIISDYQKVRNILKNLVDNAIKFTDKGAVSVDISVDRQSMPLKLNIRVKDTGIGIEENQKEFIFEKYAQIEQGYRRNYGGIGLGLSIVKNTLLLLDGNISLDSAPGKGSCFEVAIPVRVGDSSAGSPDVDEAILRKIHVLVVDDHPINRKVVTTILKKWKTNYKIALNGEEAVQAVKKSHFDIILMDIQMPVMDGYEATRKIRQLIGDKVTILALTASILREDENNCIKAGMDGIIRKPFFPDNLKHWVKTRKAPSEKQIKNSMQPGQQDEQVTDLAYLTEVSGGNKEFIDEMVTLFITQSDSHLSGIRKGIETESFEKITLAAHKMKPVLGYVGISLDTAPIRKIEELAKAGHGMHQIKDYFEHLQQIIEKANQELKSYLDQ